MNYFLKPQTINVGRRRLLNLLIRIPGPLPITDPSPPLDIHTRLTIARRTPFAVMRDAASSVSYSSSSLSGMESSSVRQTTILLGRIPSIHVATSLVATLGQLTHGPPMAHHSQAHLPSALPDLKGNRVLQRHQPVPPHLRQHVRTFPIVVTMSASIA
jgi:hypothetical protein